MKSRWQVAALLITLPVWAIPVLLYVGWKEAGRANCADIPYAIRYVFTGKM